MAERRRWARVMRIGWAAGVVLLAALATEARHPGTWSLAPDMPATLSHHGSVAIDGTVYVIGGLRNVMVENRVFALDLATSVWSERSPMPAPRAAFATAVVGGSIYVIGGVGPAPYSEQGSVLVYRPGADAWTVAADLPTMRWGLGAAVLGGKIWAVGGVQGIEANHEVVLPTVEIFDPATGEWTAEKASLELPRARAGLAVVESGGRLWAIGGRGDDGVVSGRVDVWDPALRKWLQQPSLTMPRAHHAAAVVDGELYVLGGFDEQGAAVECVETLAGQWSSLGRMPKALYGLAAAAAGDRILLSGGAGATDVASVMVYSPTVYSYWADAAAHVAGSNGSQWRTTVSVVNGGDDLAQVEMVFHGEYQQGRLARSIEAGSQTVVEDVVGEMGMTGAGMLEVRSSQPLLLCGRTFTDQGHGTFGQSCELRAPDYGCGSKDTVWLTGLRQQNGTARTNLVVANAGLWPAAVAVTLYRSDGAQVARYAFLVQPGQSYEDLEPFAARAGLPNVGCGYARVQIANGAGVFVSASVIDAVTNDATTIFPKE